MKLKVKSFWFGKRTGSCIALCYASTQSALVFRSFTHLKTHLYSSELDTCKFLPLKKNKKKSFHALLFKVSHVYEDKEQGIFICIYNCASLVQRIKFKINISLYLFIKLTVKQVRVNLNNAILSLPVSSMLCICMRRMEQSVQEQVHGDRDLLQI